MIKNLKEKAGYVSVETVIIAGLMISLGVFAITQLFSASESVVADGHSRVMSITTDMVEPTMPA